jgi:hypothetical protein
MAQAESASASAEPTGPQTIISEGLLYVTISVDLIRPKREEPPKPKAAENPAPKARAAAKPKPADAAEPK